MTLGVSFYLIFTLSLYDGRWFHKVTVLDKDNYNNKINYFSHFYDKNTWQKKLKDRKVYSIVVGKCD